MNPKDFTPFDEADPFHPENRLEGFISHKPTNLYGALLITRVNGRDVPPQLIYGTPKIHYPFDVSQDEQRHYRFPKAVAVDAYEKLDGTNVLAYWYDDPHSHSSFLTYKPRLRPFLANSRFGDFLDMWKEFLPDIQNEIIEESRARHNRILSISFELYGSRNMHLIRYNTPLRYAMLFAVDSFGNILPPSWFNETTLDKAALLSRVHSVEELKSAYEGMQMTLEANLRQVDDEHYSGDEGAVWYLLDSEGRWHQFKCKPETIEEIHWANGGLGKAAIVATCWNALETNDALTWDAVKALLAEEYQSDKIDAQKGLVERCMVYVTEAAAFQKEVMTDYRALGMDINADKAGVMRALSKKYPKAVIGRVYGIVAGLERRA